MPTRRRTTAAARRHPLVDGAARTALAALEQALGELAEELSRQEQAAAAGPGTAESMIGARLANPVPARLDWNRGGGMRDAEVRRLREVKLAAVSGIADWARWVAHETHPNGRVATG
ncbi:MAG TPA: hypothetical protein VIV12_22960 [Streptosporangiaceae bacterium]